MLDSSQREMLHEYGTLILADTINHDGFECVLEAAMRRPDEMIYLHCRGDGGESRAMIAMVDVIGAHGQFTGVLMGAALSSHAIVWAACQQRLVAANGSIGVHSSSVFGIDQADTAMLYNKMHETRAIDGLMAQILADACHPDSDYSSSSRWADMICNQGGMGVVRFNAAFLLENGMAKAAGRIPLRVAVAADDVPVAAVAMSAIRALDMGMDTAAQADLQAENEALQRRVAELETAVRLMAWGDE